MQKIHIIERVEYGKIYKHKDIKICKKKLDTLRNNEYISFGSWDEKYSLLIATAGFFTEHKIEITIKKLLGLVSQKNKNPEKIVQDSRKNTRCILKCLVMSITSSCLKFN